MTILDTLAKVSKERVEKQKEEIPLEKIKEEALSLGPKDFEFEKALKGDDLAFILECKKASPSKGLIDPVFDYLTIAKEYNEAGAQAISCLTEPEYFLGNIDYLEEISKAVSLPVLRKDFITDSYMIYEARIKGASAVLLICALLEEDKLKELIGVADSLGLSALVEAHDSDEIEKAIRAGARVIGVNNRDLRDFNVDTNNSTALRKNVPEGILFVSESGINSREDIINLEEAGVDAVLIGETMMKAQNKKEKLKELRGEND